MSTRICISCKLLLRGHVTLVKWLSSMALKCNPAWRKLSKRMHVHQEKTKQLLTHVHWCKTSTTESHSTVGCHCGAEGRPNICFSGHLPYPRGNKDQIMSTDKQKLRRNRNEKRRAAAAAACAPASRSTAAVPKDARADWSVESKLIQVEREILTLWTNFWMKRMVWCSTRLSRCNRKWNSKRHVYELQLQKNHLRYNCFTKS